MSLVKFIYRAGVRLATRFRLYELRTRDYVRFILSELAKVKGGVVVDVGCGGGSLTRTIAELSRDISMMIGLDISCEQLRGASNPRVTWVCADAHNLPFKDSSVDAIIELSLIEHLENPKEHVREVSRVLKKGGRMLIQLPNLDYLIEPHTKFPMFLLPNKIKYTLTKALGYAYINTSKSNSKR